MRNLSHKFLAVFGQGNIERVDSIVKANKQPAELAKISPSFIVMDLNWRCNYKCSCCIDRNAVNQGQKDLPVELIEDVLDYSKAHGVRGIMTMGGEPFLYPEGIKKVLEKSIEYKIPVKTVSNGSRLEHYLDLIIDAYKIPGSMLRISINSDKENYNRQTLGETELEKILESIKKITSSGTPVYVSTVIFTEESKKEGAIPNVDSLEKIIGYCEDVEVKTHILIPGRNPATRNRYHRNDKEKKIIEEIKRKVRDGGYKTEIGIEEYTKQLVCSQNLDFNQCCPSGFIFTLIGSDGKVYKCTDNRGKDSMVIGKIEKPGDFEKFWHSEQRVEMQKRTSCLNKGCTRYDINCLLNSCIQEYCSRGLSFVDYLETKGGLNSIFI